ncbi:MAG: hydroxyacid dehydrogenase, partial [Flavobacteriaceae bacterium]|nr:hydroxyacid dehydrogenase [Flavobacteriaceae bacterium]
MRILHLDINHPILLKELNNSGFENLEDYTSPKETIQANMENIHGIVIRSRFKIDQGFIDSATNLKFIARVGAGLENIDVDYA